MKVRRKDTPVYEVYQYYTGDIVDFVHCLVVEFKNRDIPVRDFSLDYEEDTQTLKFSFVADISPVTTKFMLRPGEYVVFNPDDTIEIMNNEKYREVFG